MLNYPNALFWHDLCTYHTYMWNQLLYFFGPGVPSIVFAVYGPHPSFTVNIRICSMSFAAAVAAFTLNLNTVVHMSFTKFPLYFAL